MEMGQYYLGVKRVLALKKTLGEYNKLRGLVIPSNEDPDTEGYYVIYEDGYASWCPKKQFEEANRPIDAMTFGHAVEAMKRGEKVARKGWNGSGMFAYYVPAMVRAAKDSSEHTFEGMVYIRETLMLKTVQNDHATWSPSGSDALAEDWNIVK